MKTNTAERLVVIHNTNSSHAANVQRGVFDRLDAAGLTYERFLTPSPQPVDNIDAIAHFVRAGDRVLSAGGDGTANAVANGLLEANLPGVTAGFLGYGNFDDMSHTFDSRSAQRNPLRLLNTTETTTVQPLDVIVNDELWRRAMLYTTLGWTALAAHEFDDPKTREQLQHGGANILSSLARLGLMYFKTRHESALPPFSREDGSRYDSLTDVLAVNGPIMAKIIRSGQRKYAEPDFLHRDLDVSGLVKNVPFLAASGLGRMPGTPVTSDTLYFDAPSTIPVQLDGEFSQLHGVSTLSIRKSPNSPALRVMTNHH
jgi:diacylglycerol kinase family enzyme